MLAVSDNLAQCFSALRGHQLRLGILIGAVISMLLRTFVPSIPATISYLWVTVGFTISVGVGLFFGYYPAKVAANLNPIDCLRYE